VRMSEKKEKNSKYVVNYEIKLRLITIEEETRRGAVRELR
jgi:hypothetical protein